MKNRITFVALCFFNVVISVSLFGAVRLASPFTSHMVLQRDLPVPVWGWASPMENVTVNFAGQSLFARADSSGSWRVTLAPLAASAEGRVLSVSGAESEKTLALEDVLVGEVWLCSGQSNMDFTVAKTDKYYFAGVNNEAEEVAAANYPLIRMFTGEWQKAYAPMDAVAGAWKVCTPENVREFSAVGYFFARDLQKDLRVPVGIVTMTFGASCAQAWVRREAMVSDSALKAVLEKFDEQVKAYTPPSVAELADWEAAVAKAKADGKRPPRKPKPDPVQDQHNPTVMYNGMIAPIVPYAIRGVLWYQGESITEPKELFPRWNETLIRDWRALWGRSQSVAGSSSLVPLPFYFVQLAAHKVASNSPQVRAWQAQALSLSDTGMAVTIDIGDFDNVHPKNKQDVGARLALIARAKTYGEKIECSGPVAESVSVRGTARRGEFLRIRFSHAEGGLVGRGGALRTFEVAGEDGKFVTAQALIDPTDSSAILVSVPDSIKPRSVRYAWSSFPEGCNLYNAENLPAAPFALSLRE